MFLHVIEAEYLGDYRLKLKFNNGAEGVVDLESELYGEIFEPLRDKEMFKRFRLTSRTVEWPNEADFAPEFLFDAAGLGSEHRVQRRTSSLPTTFVGPAPVGVAVREQPAPYQASAPQTEES